MSSFTINKMFEIYTFYKNRTEIYTFFKNRTEIYTFFENGFEIYICILFENRTEISNILSMADEVTINLQTGHNLKVLGIPVCNNYQASFDFPWVD